MDRSWMNVSRVSDEFENGIDELLKFAKQHRPEPDGKYFCPCINCLNGRRHDEEKIREHLIFDGIDKSYTIWIWHGESLNAPTKSNEPNNEHWDNRFDDMIRDVGVESFYQSQVYDDLKNDSEIPLYPGCKTFTRLSAVLKLVIVKARNGWTDKSFTELLELLKEMLPEDNTLPNRNYEAKKVLCPMGMEYKKIHACPNDCILYRKEFEALNKCPRCGVSRYKAKYDDCSGDNNSKTGPPAKVLWYLPIIPRFKRLFANVVDAKNLTWHANGRKCDGQLRHPADSSQWKKIDRLFPRFGNEERNLRLGLATDGMNPYGNLSTNHSSWPVLLVIYNLPHWLCMKRKYVLLSMMISGPKQPGNDIDVYRCLKNDDLYGYLEPHFLQSIGNKKEETVKYIIQHIRNSKKKIYLGAYHKESHWQLLVIVPDKRIVVWLCSQHRKPTDDITRMVQSVLTTLSLLDGKPTSKSKNSIQWIKPKCHKQKRNWECGYFVMHWMWTIVRVSIQKNWNEVFSDTSSLDENDIAEIRIRWARYILEIKDKSLYD